MNNVPLWIIAIVLCLALLSAFGCCACFGLASYQQKQELLRQEPWRRFE